MTGTFAVEELTTAAELQPQETDYQALLTWAKFAIATTFATGWLAELYGTDIKKAVGKTHATRWAIEPWALGAFLPSLYWSNSYWIHDYNDYGLDNPSLVVTFSSTDPSDRFRERSRSSTRSPAREPNA